MEITFHQFSVAMLLTFLAGIATSIGGAVAFFAHEEKKRGQVLSFSLGFSGGVMIYVSLVQFLLSGKEILIAEYGKYNGLALGLCAFCFGIILTAVIDRLVPDVENPHTAHSANEMSRAENATDFDKKKLGRAGLFFALAIAIHNFPEGLATLASGLSGTSLGISVAFAVAVHNIPEGIAVAVPICYATGSRTKAFAYSTFSGLAEPLGALVGFIILYPILCPVTFALLFAVVAGIMIYITFDELLPTAALYKNHHLATLGIFTGMLLMAACIDIFK